jgi:hypothetical protein
MGRPQGRVEQRRQQRGSKVVTFKRKKKIAKEQRCCAKRGHRQDHDVRVWIDNTQNFEVFWEDGRDDHMNHGPDDRDEGWDNRKRWTVTLQTWTPINPANDYWSDCWDVGWDDAWGLNDFNKPSCPCAACRYALGDRSYY